ncbi:GA module-containing protein, partial [Gardnerella vaginalis]
GGVFVSPAYADGYVSGDGARVYYGYKADADYSKERLLIKVTYYKTKADALKGGNDGVDPLGKFVRVEYTSNNPEDANKQPDKWALRPTWWFGVPKGLKTNTISQIRLVRNERGTQEASSSPATGTKKLKDASRQGYVVASDHTYNNIDQWKHSVSRDYYSGSDKTIDGKGWQRMVGITKNEKDYDNSGNTKDQWNIYKDGEANGLQGIFADWESAGQRYYEMSYVAEMTDEAWMQRDQKPLLFVAGIYRGVGNWRYVAGTTMRAPKIADHLELKYPKPTSVKNLDSLDENEQAAVKKAIEDVNKSADSKNPNLFDKLVAKDGVSVDAKGNATITFTDNTKRVMPANLLVLKNETDKDKYKPTLPARTPVVKPSKLTDEDKKTVIAAFKKANPDDSEFSKHLAKDNAIAFDKDGKNLVVTYEDGSNLEIPASDLVYQGATIADWAPYRVPVPTEVDDPSKALTEKQKTDIASAFDEANKSFPVYQAAKTHNSNTSPVTFDKKNNAVITWEDGSQTTIPAWQFLKKKQTQSSKPEQKQTTKEFTVDLPQTPTEVAFDPFDKTATIDNKQLTNLEASLQALTAKDASDSNKTVTLTSAKISIADGTVTFKAKGYEDRKYPIGIFYKKQSTGTGTQNPTPQTPTSKTDTVPGNEKDKFTYNVRKIETDKDKPTAQDAIKALKQFVKDNYDNVSEDDLASVSDSVAVKTTWTPKAGTKNMGPYGAHGNNGGPMTSFSIDPTSGFAITVHGHPWSDDDNGGDWNAESEMPLFTIQASDLYVKKGTQQTPTDNTVEKLKALAKQLLDEKKNLTKSDFTRAGLDKDKITNEAINKMNDAEDLRDLIKKLSEAKHADRTYNSAGDVVVDDPTKLTEDDFKKAVKAFFDANYDGQNSFQVTTNGMTIPYLPSASDLKPKSGTIDMEIADNNIKSVTSSKTGDADDYKSMVFKDAKGTQLFTVAISYKKKEETPKLSDDELKEMRKQAKETIDHNPNLTKTDKDGFDDRIDTANTAEEIQKILKEAADKANQNSTSGNPEIKGEISGNQSGTDAENQQKLDAAKEAAKDIISKLPNLSDDEKKDLTGKVTSATDINGVNSVVDEAKKLSELKGVKEEAQKATFVFLDHGKGGKDDSSDPNHTEDAALNELLGTKPAEDSTLADLAKKLKKDSNATAAEIRDALDAAKLQNTSNEQNAKNAGIAKLEAKKAELDAAYNALTEEQKKNATKDYTAATAAIETAKTTVDSATKPSDITGALNKVNTALTAANTAVENAKGKRDTSSITNDQNSELNKEKEAQKKRINGSDLPDAEKQKAIKDIEAATMLGDPTGIANRYLKAQKIEDAKKQIAALEYLNKAQKQYYKDLLDSTDASDHVDEAGKPTGKDDIDDALEQALNLNGVMKRLADLATSADKLKKDNKDQKYSSATEDKKSAFDAALNAANTQLDKVDGVDSDNINADGANALYNDLLKAMQGLDSSVKGVDLYTEDLRKEYTDDVALKEKPVYKNATKNVKEAFDAAVTAAKAALENATKNPTALGADAAAQQNAIGAALANLVNTRKALDGIDTTALQAEVDKDKLLTDKPVYKNATENKKTDFDKALAAAEDAIADAEGKKHLVAGEDPKTQEQKQKAVNDALTALRNAAKALDGKEQKPTPAPSVDKTGLKALVDAAGQVKDSDAYKYADADKQGAYDKAISDGQSVLAKTDATADDVANAVHAITTAKAALDGKKPAPTPAPSVDKS